MRNSFPIHVNKTFDRSIWPAGPRHEEKRNAVTRASHDKDNERMKMLCFSMLSETANDCICFNTLSNNMFTRSLYVPFLNMMGHSILIYGDLACSSVRYRVPIIITFASSRHCVRLGCFFPTLTIWVQQVSLQFNNNAFRLRVSNALCN